MNLKDKEVTIPTLVTFFDIYINNDIKKDKNEIVRDFIRSVYKATNGIIEDHYSEIEADKIKIELCCKTINVDIPISCNQKNLENTLYIKVKEFLRELSKEIQFEIDVKEVENTEYPQYYLSEEELERYNKYFENSEDIIEEEM